VALIVAGLLLAIVVIISQVVLRRLAADQDSHLSALAETYLDGVSSAVLPGVLRRDVWETFDALDRSKTLYGGLAARWVAVVLPDGSVLAASDPSRFPVGTRLPSDIDGLRMQAPLLLDPDGRTAWLSRQLYSGGTPLGWLIAELDVSARLAVRREVLLTLVLVNGAFAIGFALLGSFIVFRILAPVRVLARHLAATPRMPEPILQSEFHGLGPEFATLFVQFNAMARAVGERHALAARLAEEERLSVLGKLASGMAHEVNNPLGGMLTAVDTIATHGADLAVRTQAVGFLRRGLQDIRNVVKASLVLYKGQASPSHLTPAALDDLRHLASPEASRRQVALAWNNGIPQSLLVDATAVRQVVLNLLLNAVAASTPGGTVRFEAWFEDDILRAGIADDGPGLPAEIAAFVAGDSDMPVPRNAGLGLWTAFLVARRAGGRIRRLPAAHGTHLVLEMPATEFADAAVAA
jgi:signal transduction histidine kinase